MIQVMSMNKQLQKLPRGSMSFIRLALLGLLFAASPSHGQQAKTEDAEVFEGGEVPLSGLSGKRIDKDWFRYTNGRFGLAIDVPARGYRYVLPVNGSGMAVISADEKEDDRVTITIYTHWVVNLFDNAGNNVDASIKSLFDKAVDETRAANGSVTYNVRKKQFYVISGHFDGNTFYERMIISPKCPAIFNSVRVFSPKAREREIDKLVTRLSLSLRATCQGGEGAVKFHAS
jgi:hypothetical protein